MAEERIIIITIPQIKTEKQHMAFEKKMGRELKKLFKERKFKGRMYSNKTGEGIDFS